MTARQRDAFGRPLTATLVAADACPDCNADVSVVEIEPGVYKGTILHDETCPYLSAREQRIARAREGLRDRGLR
ncbi:hypothetical protein [Microbacterium karelineae]|uniref:hypothetical protein n=1 Tax=Microbacterium karelineae TaxID=2654283 RepID=UPI0012E9E6E2|nr:hypothetical protein [Microbacterium karelineae]